MTPQQMVDLRGYLTTMMQIAHGLGSTHTEADLLQSVANLEKWIDHQINLEVTAAVKPFMKFDIVRGGKGK